MSKFISNFRYSQASIKIKRKEIRSEMSEKEHY